MIIEEIGEKRVTGDCLNFGVSLCKQIKKQTAVRETKN